MILLDTNIMLRFTDAASPDCAASRKALHTLRQRGELLVLVPQNLYEYWAVATRQTGNFPTANGLALSINRVDQWIGYWLRNYALLPDPPNLSKLWRTLVHMFNVAGKKSHDVRLVAAMQAHNITHLLTFNAKDFTRFPAVTLLDPHAIS